MGAGEKCVINSKVRVMRQIHLPIGVIERGYFSDFQGTVLKRMLCLLQLKMNLVTEAARIEGKYSTRMI